MSSVYSRESILKKLEDLIGETDSLSYGLLNYAKKLNQVELENFLIMINDSIEEEKQVEPEQKSFLNKVLTGFFHKATVIYNKCTKQVIDELAEKDAIDGVKQFETLIN